MSDISEGIRQNPISRRWEIKGSAVVRAWRMGGDEFRRIISRGKKPNLLSLKEKSFGYFPFQAFRENHHATTLDSEMARYAGNQMREDHEVDTAPQEYDAVCMSLWFDMEEISSAPEFSAETITPFAKAVILKRCTGAGLEPVQDDNGAEAKIKDALPEVEELYEMVKVMLKLKNGISNSSGEDIKAQTIECFNNRTWNTITAGDLQADYNFPAGQVPRDFRLRILRRVLNREGFDLSFQKITDTINNLRAVKGA